MRQCLGSLTINLSDCGGNRELADKIRFYVPLPFSKNIIPYEVQ